MHLLNVQAEIVLVPDVRIKKIWEQDVTRMQIALAVIV